jgi:hypothetical protein
VKDAVEVMAEHLSYILEQGTQGSHVLFENEQIRHAFRALDRLTTVDEDSLEGVRSAVRDLANLPTLEQKRDLIDGLPELHRDLLILFYFQFIDRLLSDRRNTLH